MSVTTVRRRPCDVARDRVGRLGDVDLERAALREHDQRRCVGGDEHGGIRAPRRVCRGCAPSGILCAGRNNVLGVDAVVGADATWEPDPCPVTTMAPATSAAPTATGHHRFALTSTVGD